jgi:hypothetical protein
MEFVEALRAAKTSADFVTACYDALDGSPWAGEGLRNYTAAAPMCSGINPVGWQWYLPKGMTNLSDVFYEFCFNASLNGGYWYADPQCEIAQWNINGSGSQALCDWISNLRTAERIPGLHPLATIADKSLWREFDYDFAQRLNGLPYANERLDICRRFAGWKTRRDITRLLTDTLCRNGKHMEVRLEHVDALVSIVPEGFGDDPFRKKAILAFAMMAGWLASKGLEVDNDLPIPADYQLPRIFEFFGAIRATDAMVDRLKSPDLLDPNSEAVMHWRAAAIVAARATAEAVQTPDYLVDSHLFTSMRKDPEFQARALPPMRISGMWF